MTSGGAAIDSKSSACKRIGANSKPENFTNAWLKPLIYSIIFEFQKKVFLALLNDLKPIAYKRIRI
jgi:hypothetical protein